MRVRASVRVLQAVKAAKAELDEIERQLSLGEITREQATERLADIRARIRDLEP